MEIENVLQIFSCISFLFKPPWYLEGLNGLVVNNIHVEKYISNVDFTDRWLYNLAFTLVKYN